MCEGGLGRVSRIEFMGTKVGLVRCSGNVVRWRHDRRHLAVRD